MKEEVFTHGDKQYLVVTPTAAQIIESKLSYNTAFKKSVDSGAYLRKAWDAVLEEQGLWSAEKTKRIASLQFLLAKLERKLNSKIKMSEAKEVAKSLAEARSELRKLVYERTELDDRTAEGQAEQSRLEHLCSLCLLNYVDRKRVYNDVASMIESGSEVVSMALDRLAAIVYNVDPDFEAKLPENKFFSRFGEPEVELETEVQEFLKDITDIQTVGDVSTIEYEDDSSPSE
jgi:hypothetical protein